jgi:hypothetical protein
MDSGLPTVFMINLGKAGGNGNKANNAQPQPLCQWSEVPNHPGLVCSVMQSSEYYRLKLYKTMFFWLLETPLFNFSVSWSNCSCQPLLACIESYL